MLTPKQVSALKYLINMARIQCDLAKSVLWFLIDHSEGGTKDVCLTLQEDHEGYNREEINQAAHAAGSMNSVDQQIHLGAICQAIGISLFFSVHYGSFVASDDFGTEGQFPGYGARAPGHENDREDMPLRYTFWFSKKFYSETAELLSVSREYLDAIDLEKSGLYPALESQTISA